MVIHNSASLASREAASLPNIESVAMGATNFGMHCLAHIPFDFAMTLTHRIRRVFTIEEIPVTQHPYSDIDNYLSDETPDLEDARLQDQTTLQP